MTDKQKTYLRQHGVAVLLDGIVRDMLTAKPGKPFEFIVKQLQEAEKKAGDGTAKTESVCRQHTPPPSPHGTRRRAFPTHPPTPTPSQQEAATKEEAPNGAAPDAAGKDKPAEETPDAAPATEAPAGDAPKAEEGAKDEAKEEEAAAPAEKKEDEKKEGEEEELPDLAAMTNEDQAKITKIQVRFLVTTTVATTTPPPPHTPTPSHLAHRHSTVAARHARRWPS